LGVPLRADAKTFGAITIYSKLPDPFSEDEVKLLVQLGDDVSYCVGALRLRAAKAQADLERQRAQAALQKANEELEQRVADRTAELHAASRYARSLIEASLDPLVTISPDGKITDVNEATELVTGVARNRLIGSDFSRFFTEPARAEAGYHRVLAEGLVRDYPLTIRHTSGQTTEVLYHATVYHNEVGQVQGVFAAARDITERKRMERELQASEARYRSLVTAASQIVWITDAGGQVATEMPTWQAFTGQTFEQYRDSGWAEALHPQDRQRTQEIWQRAVASRSSYETEYLLRRHDGEYRQVVARGVPVLAKDGTIREWVGTCTDITERKQAERRREFTSALLALFAQKSAAPQYLHSLLEVLSQWSGCQAIGIRVADENGEIPYQTWSGFEPEFIELENRLSLQRDNCCCIRAISQAFEKPDRSLLTPGGSYRCDDAIAFVNKLPPAEGARYRGNCMKFGFASLAIVPIRYRNEVIGAIHLADRRPDQFPLAAVEFLETMTPLVGEALHRFRMEAELARHRDQLEVLVRQRTQELTNANARLQETAEDLERSNRDLEQFAYVASHDLQEPLRAVGGYVKLIERRLSGTLDARVREFIAGAFEGALRMERLISDLLAFSRVGTRGGDFVATDFDTALQQALRNLEASIESAPATVTHDPLPTLTVDATQIMQLFQNLLGNALKFRAEAPLRVHVGAQKQDGRWVFSVRDNGIGIEPQYFEKIFQIFQRLHTRKQYSGTGIGLAICKKIVERHGGTIWVESQPGQGSTFYFSLPDTAANTAPEKPA
jgi:PAS domain S-box-containing protein